MHCCRLSVLLLALLTILGLGVLYVLHEAHTGHPELLQRLLELNERFVLVKYEKKY
jgi:hypothetical protein